MNTNYKSRLPLISILALLILYGLVRVRFPQPPESEQRERAALDHSNLFDQPDEAAEYFLLKRLPKGASELPVEKYQAALQQMKNMPVYSTALGRRLNLSERSAAEALGAWSFLGPGNIGGRTRAWVIHPTTPDTMFAAGVAGGVWKTTNSGASWVPISDLIANLAVCTLALASTNPDVIYAGTGESFAGTIGLIGNGIFKTTDGGASWMHLSATANNANFRLVNKLVVSPNNSQVVYAATNSGLWRSLDGGASWNRTLNQPNCTDLVGRTGQAADQLIIACRPDNQGTIYRNTDAGGAGTWEPVHTETGIGRISLALAPSNQAIVYALAVSLVGGPNNRYANGLHAVFRSTSGGAAGTWEARVRNTDATLFNTLLLTNLSVAVCNNSFINQGNYDSAIAVDPADPNRVWVGGVAAFRSDDGGANWGLAACGDGHVDYHTIVFHPQFNGASNKTMFVGNDGGVFKTTDARAAVRTTVCGQQNCAGQVTFTTLNNSFGVTQFYHGSPYPDGKTYFGGAQDNGVSRGTDASGPNNWTQIQGGDGGYVAVDPNNTNTLYIEIQNGAIQKSTNGGANFAPATTGLSESRFLFIPPLVMDPTNAQRLWVGGSKLWRTSNGASNWTQASAELTNDTTSAIVVSPTNANNVLAGTASGFIHRTDVGTTSDANTVWPRVRPRSGLVSWVAYDPNNTNIAYATYSTFSTLPTDRHVYKSTDGGTTWESLDGTGASALPDVPTHCIVVDPINSNRLYVGTDVGVFSSIDGGVTWAVENTGFANVITEALAINTSGAKQLFAFTHGRGAWRVALNTVNCPAITIAQTTLPNGALNTSYNQSLTASGGTTPHTFSLSAGELPPGLTLAATGVLSGTPTTPGNFTFAVRATDTNGCLGTRVFTLQIACQAITLNPTTLPQAAVGTAYSQQLTAAGGIGSVGFALFNTSLPVGLTLSPTGLLSGTPTAAGAFSFTVRATDSNACTGVRTYSLVITGVAPNLVPALASMTVTAMAVGSPGFNLRVGGANFINGSVVRWNGADRATTFISSAVLQAAIPATDLAAVGTAAVTVFTPAPGGGVSAALTFRIVNRVVCVSAASFIGTEVAPESVIAAFGVNLANGIEVAATIPLPTSLRGSSLLIRDSQGTERPAPLFFVSPGQVNFLLPSGTAVGVATITANSTDGQFSLGTINVASVAPGLFSATASGQGPAAAVVLRLKADGSQSFEPVSAINEQNAIVTVPIDLGAESDQVFLLLFGTGFRFNTGLAAVSARIGGLNAEVLFAGAQGDLAGLDQSNIRIPRSLGGRGEVDVALTINGKVSNLVRINIK